ncbi:hypothetical protein ABZ312_23620 [Streptomyces sp. NPDC006207]
MDWLGRWSDRIQGRAPRAIRRLDEHAGETLAQWALKNVLYTRKRPVPSFGFGLSPILAHSVAARRQRRIRIAALTFVVAQLTVSHLRGMAAIVATIVLWQFLSGHRGRGIFRWGSRSIVSGVLFAGAVFAAWTLVRPYVPVVHGALTDATRVAPLLIAACSVVYLIDRWASHAYLQSLRPGRPHIGQRPHLAPLAARKVTALRVTERWQSIAYRNESGTDRFVGAGLNAWGRGATRIQLTPARTAEEGSRTEEVVDDSDPGGYRKFEADELLDKVRDEIEDLCGILVETHALPNCDVAEFLGVPESRWKKLSGAAANNSEPSWPEATEMCTEAQNPPTGHFARRYLAAQVVSWDGQVVVTVFAHAALEGKTLHFVTRPHILAPLLSSSDAPPPKGWALIGQMTAAPLNACGDTVALAARFYTSLGRSLGLIDTGQLAERIQPQRDDGLPVSLREHCGLVRTNDMHQTEDVQRYVSILQSRMFSTVSAFLADHGLATAEFRRQAVAITQNFITGDNNQVNTGTLGGNMHQQGSSPSVSS